MTASTLAAAVAKTPDEQTVEARDAAVRQRLKDGPATVDQLVALFHLREPELTEDDRRQAVHRSLSRLRLKDKAVRHVAGDASRWELAP